MQCHFAIFFPKSNWLSLQIAVEKFSEATVGYRDNREIAEQWVQLFSTPYFMVTPVSTIIVLFLSISIKFMDLFTVATLDNCKS